MERRALKQPGHRDDDVAAQRVLLQPPPQLLVEVQLAEALGDQGAKRPEAPRVEPTAEKHALVEGENQLQEARGLSQTPSSATWPSMRTR